MSVPRILILPTPDDLADRAARLIVEAAGHALEQRGRFTLVLSGGSTPEKTYTRLARPDLAGQLDWNRTGLFFGDERFVPPDDARSNYHLARRTLIDHVPIPSGNVFPIPTGLPGPADAATAYAATLTREVPASSGPPVFDLILLGLGDDGHTASLFPGQPSLTVRDRWVIACPPGVLPPPVDRVTLTFPVLNAARQVAFLVAGANKASVVRDVLAGTPPETHPAAGVRPTNGQLTWLLDQAAGRLVQPG
jgi:6-phosphogluconolactonase